MVNRRVGIAKTFIATLIETGIMAFGFPQVQKRRFKRNFLRMVTVQLLYGTTGVYEKKDFIRNYWDTEFPRFSESSNATYSITSAKGQTPIIQQSNGPKSCTLTSDDGKTQLSISDTATTLVILGDKYKSFDDIVPILSKSVHMFSQFGLSVVNSISIRKLNVVSFQTTEGGIDSVMADLFSQQIFSPSVNFPKMEAVGQDMRSLVFKEADYRLNLNYGIPELDNASPDLKGSVVIDIDLHKMSETQTEDLVKESQCINDKVYDVFSWVTSKKAKEEIMEYED